VAHVSYGAKAASFNWPIEDYRAPIAKLTVADTLQAVFDAAVNN
jgi:hypothetical protein